MSARIDLLVPAACCANNTTAPRFGCTPHNPSVHRAPPLAIAAAAVFDSAIRSGKALLRAALTIVERSGPWPTLK
jgi:hypothetical protein